MSIAGLQGIKNGKTSNFLPFFKIGEDVFVEDTVGDFDISDNAYKMIFRSIEVVNDPAILAKTLNNPTAIPGTDKAFPAVVVPDKFVRQQVEDDNQSMTKMIADSGVPVGWMYSIYIDLYHLMKRLGMDSLYLTDDYAQNAPSLSAYLRTEYVLFQNETEQHKLPLTNNNEEPLFDEKIGEPVHYRGQKTCLPQFKELEG